MGQTLSKPVLDIEEESGQNKRVAYAVACMQGWRDSMEDAHTTKLQLADDDQNILFAVFDGHADESLVSKFAAETVPEILRNDHYIRKEYSMALKKAFLDTDHEIATRKLVEEAGGATAVAMLYTSEGDIFVANAGDSRCVLGTMGRAEPLSTDHRPELEAEKARILKAGGFVSEDNRVNGLLAPSRALGDFFYKRRPDLPPTDQVVTAEPEVTSRKVTADDEFVVLACDGIWDVLTSQQVIDSVRRQIASGASLQECCNRLLDASLSPTFGGIGCDNMTVIICALLQGKTFDEWAAMIKARVHNGEGHITPEELPTFFSPTVLQEAKEHWKQITEDQAENGPSPPITFERIAVQPTLFT